eukprot:TRINITY_DN545016_c0_g1_i1.p1 TRINITY_DN545016_c0_g1~~TRINITY_DN545016_c0_g1_i1.p1  ORF type:complete len:236 (-),score=52.13 TRINITY_DN545016_c0_g1_i1:160-867(-)
MNSQTNKKFEKSCERLFAKCFDSDKTAPSAESKVILNEKVEAFQPTIKTSLQRRVFLLEMKSHIDARLQWLNKHKFSWNVDEFVSKEEIKTLRSSLSQECAAFVKEQAMALATGNNQQKKERLKYFTAKQTAVAASVLQVQSFLRLEQLIDLKKQSAMENCQKSMQSVSDSLTEAINELSFEMEGKTEQIFRTDKFDCFNTSFNEPVQCEDDLLDIGDCSLLAKGFELLMTDDKS